MDSSHLNKNYLARRQAKNEMPLKESALLKHFLWTPRDKEAINHGSHSQSEFGFMMHCSVKVETCKKFQVHYVYPISVI